MSHAPIGICDSGLGGLSVWKEVQAILPHESILYYADSAHCPYGPRSEQEILRLCERMVYFFLKNDCKLILLACNTATAAAIQQLRQAHNVAFVGMEPAIKPAALQTKTGKVGILATEGTFRGGHFLQTRETFASHIEVHIQVGHGLVGLVEKGELGTERARKLLKSFLLPMLEEGVDQIVLGCTHYPFLRPLMEEIVDGQATIIDPAPAVARQVKFVLRKYGLLNMGSTQGSTSFYSSGNLIPLRQMVSRISNRTHQFEQHLL